MDQTGDVKNIYDHFLKLKNDISILYSLNEARAEMSDAVVAQISQMHRELDDIKGRLKFAEEKIEIIAEKAFTAIEVLYPGRNQAECVAINALQRIVDEARKKPKA